MKREQSLLQHQRDLLARTMSLMRDIERDMETITARSWSCRPAEEPIELERPMSHSVVMGLEEVRRRKLG